MNQKRDLVLCGCGWEESPWSIKNRADGRYYLFGTSVLECLAFCDKEEVDRLNILMGIRYFQKRSDGWYLTMDYEESNNLRKITSDSDYVF